jgi:5-(carboxyamino)imidazole ribonucleotide mutase
MGSRSDLEVMSHAAATLEQLKIPHEVRVMSAHRTPDRVRRFASEAESRGIEAIIAGAGAAAHLAGVTAAHTLVPVLGVPLDATPLRGVDALYGTVQMPAGIPVATFAIGRAGAVNAALFAAAMLARREPELRERVASYREARARALPDEPL